ncbi:MAG TPA: MFS transporter [Nocardioidaceae bacterium]|nr:MFS transporter [Nocardioidaceae bacterium]
MSTLTAGAPSRGWVGHPYRWWVLALVLAAEVMDLLDATIVTIAGPAITGDLGGSSATLQWLLAAYTLAMAVGLIVSGRLGDRVGRKRMFLIGAAGFTLASLMCGLAWDPELLIGCRVLQGLFGAVMLPQGIALIKAVFPPDEIGKAFAAFGPVMGLSAVLGPVLSGVLVDADLFGLGWRMIFLINLPVGLFAILGARRFMPEVRAGSGARLDPLGTLLLITGCLLLFYPLVQGRELGWPTWTFAMMAGAVVVFGAFGLSERRGKEPVIAPGLFRHRGYVGGLFVIMTFVGAMIGFMLVFNAFTQYGLGYDALHAGLALVPWSLGIAVGAPLGGALLAPRLGRGCLQIGMLVAAGGMLLMWWTIGAQGASATVWDFVPATFVAGVGCGLVFAPLFDIVLADLADDEVGSGSGLLTAVQQFGNAAGAAAVGTLFFELLNNHALIDSMQVTTLVAAGMFGLSLLVSYGLPRRAREGAPAQ